MAKQWEVTEEAVETLLRKVFAGEPETCGRGLGEEPLGYVEKTLSDTEQGNFEEHIAGCDSCASEVVRLYRAMQYLATHEAEIMAGIAERIRQVKNPRVTAAAVAAHDWILSRLVTATGRFRVLIEELQVGGAGVPATDGVFANEPTEAEFTSEDGSWLCTVRESEDGETVISVETTRGELAGTLIRFALVQKQSDSDRDLAGGFMILHPAFVEGRCAARYRLISRLEPVPQSPWRLEVRTILPQDLLPADIPTLKTSIGNAADYPSRLAWRDFIRSLPGLPDKVNAEVLQVLTSFSLHVDS